MIYRCSSACWLLDTGHGLLLILLLFTFLLQAEEKIEALENAINDMMTTFDKEQRHIRKMSGIESESSEVSHHPPASLACGCSTDTKVI